MRLASAFFRTIEFFCFIPIFSENIFSKSCFIIVSIYFIECCFKFMPIDFEIYFFRIRSTFLFKTFFIRCILCFFFCWLAITIWENYRFFIIAIFFTIIKWKTCCCICISINTILFGRDIIIKINFCCLLDLIFVCLGSY